MRQEYFRRFLSRVFAGDEAQKWVLEGGTAMLARTADARATRDVDLLFTEADLDAAETELVTVAGADLKDYFKFVHKRSTDQLGGGNQRYTAGRRVVFETYLGSKRLDAISIDLVVGTEPTGAVSVREPADALELPKLMSASYRVYPVADHVADKVCAVLETHHGGAASSREKDLVDLVVIAMTAGSRPASASYSAGGFAAWPGFAPTLLGSRTVGERIPETGAADGRGRFVFPGAACHGADGRILGPGADRPIHGSVVRYTEEVGSDETSEFLSRTSTNDQRKPDQWSDPASTTGTYWYPKLLT